MTNLTPAYFQLPQVLPPPPLPNHPFIPYSIALLPRRPVSSTSSSSISATSPTDSIASPVIIRQFHTSASTRDEFFIKGLTSIKPTSSPTSTKKDCPVCLNPLHNDVVQIMACGHKLHFTCIMKLYRAPNTQHRAHKHTKCPLCRIELYCSTGICALGDLNEMDASSVSGELVEDAVTSLAQHFSPNELASFSAELEDANRRDEELVLWRKLLLLIICLVFLVLVLYAWWAMDSMYAAVAADPVHLFVGMTTGIVIMFAAILLAKFGLRRYCPGLGLERG